MFAVPVTARALSETASTVLGMDVTAYLLDSDPAIRWQVMRDLTDAPAPDVAAERAKVATEGWGARLLAEQAEDGLWDGGMYGRGGSMRTGRSTTRGPARIPHSSCCGRSASIPPSPDVTRAIARVRENVRWDYAGEPYFEGEVEPCINGGALANAAYFGQDGSHICETLLAGQLADGGWNCWDEDGTSRSSFHSTICALEGLWRWERAGGGSDAIAAARRRGEEYVLDRRLFRRASTGEIVDPRFTDAVVPDPLVLRRAARTGLLPPRTTRA